MPISASRSVEKACTKRRLPPLSKPSNSTPDRATEAYAELSMIHSNCPDARLRNPRRAAELAEKAVELEPQVSNHWTALGIARYREGQWQEARTAFDKSLQLGTGSSGGAFRWADAIDWFFLAMSHWQLGQAGRSPPVLRPGGASGWRRDRRGRLMSSNSAASGRRRRNC